MKNWYCLDCEHFFLPEQVAEGGVCPYCAGANLDKSIQKTALDELWDEEVGRIYKGVVK